MSINVDFPWTLINILSGILGVYLFFRSLECVDVVNGWGKYGEDNDAQETTNYPPTRPGRTRNDSPIFEEEVYHPGNYNTRSIVEDDDNDSLMDDVDDASDTDVMDTFLPDDETM